MATVEFLTKRVQGKEKELEKLNKKLERINKAKATNWEKNPYWYSESDLTSTLKDITEAQQALDNYKEQLKVQQEKDNSRNVKAILEFLDGWKARVSEFYHESAKRYEDEYKNYYLPLDKKYTDWCNSHPKFDSWQERRAYENEHFKNDLNAFKAKWNFLSDYVRPYKFIFNEEKFNKDLERDANAKYDFIIERTNAIVGEITDASYLTVGSKGDLNGYIIGTKGKASVQTIGAGGYNIQCYHFRTLIHAVK